MKPVSYTLNVEADQDRWFARVPNLEAQGAATWRYTPEDALQNLMDVAQMVVESFLEEGRPLSNQASDATGFSISIVCFG